MLSFKPDKSLKAPILRCCPAAIRMNAMELRVVFMGSPDFALPTLRNLGAHYPVIGVITQPDRPSGRGQQLSPPPIKSLALELGIEVFQPERLRRPESFAILQAWAPDLIVVTAYGQILRQNVLDLARYGCINVHASLLPRWRGAAPIQAAILHGDNVSGATIMKMDAGIDTGGVLARREVEIFADDTTASLSPRLAEAGAQLLIDTLPGYLAGGIHPTEQDDAQSSYAPMIKKEEGLLDFTQTVLALVNRVRAFQPWPGTHLLWQDLPLKVIRAHARFDQDAQFRLASEELPSQIPSNSAPNQPCTRTILEKLPAVRAADGWLVLDQVQPAGKKPMTGRDFLAGARAWSNS